MTHHQGCCLYLWTHLLFEWLIAYEPRHVIVDPLMYKRLWLIPWVPILTSCGFGTQVSSLVLRYYALNINLWFWDSDTEPFRVICASALSRVKTLPLLTISYSCNRRLLSAQHTSSLSKSPIPPVIGVARPHSWCWVRVNPGDRCCRTFVLLW
jgi:hypothetical protein